MWIQQKSTPAPVDELQGRTVGLKFECNQCQTEVFTDLIGVPAAEHFANGPDEGQYETEEIKCPGCDMTHEITINSSPKGVRFEVSEVQPGQVHYQVQA
ncbi:hypothetical protein [Hymenobacter rubripertinctus]|uniref:Uncharacterized protein n=1 Tax=Hymenobacter rubripertinctus TaxID=2029981 RepID=A0A418QT11_9BACT|nr:hypothetical protein [Hymenobacter rubripertinctus]RIY08261.1 hypothetical protein D0T11_14555 [Hymenobacter rubripertinctus]